MGVIRGANLAHGRRLTGSLHDRFLAKLYFRLYYVELVVLRVDTH